jgi:hypothetical protein
MALLSDIFYVGQYPIYDPWRDGRLRHAQISACAILFAMSKLLEQAIEKVRELPEDQQDIAAAELIGYLADFATPHELAAIDEGRRAYERGEIVSLKQWRHDMELGTH